ncbi:hypothetical protein MP228_008858 [Amoeboaphelidium protococcarum]|nr:hypothetical protein MP228_008858 [Amoeboaphelidium protococcarum]
MNICTWAQWFPLMKPLEVVLTQSLLCVRVTQGKYKLNPLIDAFVEEVNSGAAGWVMFDALRNKKVVVVAKFLYVLADNPRASDSQPSGGGITTSNSSTGIPAVDECAGVGSSVGVSASSSSGLAGCEAETSVVSMNQTADITSQSSAQVSAAFNRQLENEDEDDDDDYDSDDGLDDEQLAKKVKRRKKSENSHVYRIEAAYKYKLDEGIEETLKLLRLTRSDVSVPLTGGRPLAVNSMQAYQKHYRGLRYFFALIGDYSSSLMLLPNPPQYTPSMNAKSIILFIKFKRNEKGSLLKDENGNAVKCVYGHDIKCQGGWNMPQNVDQLLSAVSVLHDSRNQRGEYRDICEECIQRSERGDRSGCRFHPMAPRIWLGGDPKNSSLMTNMQRLNSRDGCSYVSEGSQPLTPWELLRLREYFISKNDAKSFMMWTMIIVSIKLFLRNDEVTDLKIHDPRLENCLNKDLATFQSDGSISSLAFYIKGKSDRVRVCLTLWTDYDVPELCPVRALLTWIFISGIRTGFLFPQESTLDAVKQVGHAAYNISYVSYHRQYQKACKIATGNPDGKFGTHTSRKTGYLLAVWGMGSEIDITKSARHASSANAALYKKDASYLLELAKTRRLDVSSVVSKFRSAYCEQLQMARSLNAAHSRGNFCLQQVSQEIVRSLCGLSDVDAVGGPRVIYDALLQLQKKETVLQLIEAKLKEIAPNATPEEINELRRMLELYANGLIAATQSAKLKQPKSTLTSQQSSSRQLREQAAVHSDDELYESDEEDTDVADVVPAITAVQQDEVVNDMPGREKVRKAKTAMAKLEAILAVDDPGSTVGLSAGAKSFYVKQYCPIMKCLRKHFGGDLDKFIAHWGNFKPTSFKTNNCSGTMDECSI